MKAADHDVAHQRSAKHLVAIDGEDRGIGQHLVPGRKRRIHQQKEQKRRDKDSSRATAPYALPQWGHLALTCRRLFWQ